ncbi:MAG: CDP-6-deoxy-delta-3,4-glucoseen reductase [Betaproteobacteria bacterium]|nr:CDP-6-deoxy-delta-3,4-glucoseen reductase [Betaproteobacteria bacterium]
MNAAVETPPATTSRAVRLPSGNTFQVDVGETVLAAAMRQNIGLPYGCRNGACGSCKGTIVSGEVDYGAYQARTLTDAEKAQGKALFCCAKPKTDLVLDVREISAGDIQVRTLPCRVEKIDKLAHDVVALKLRLPANERLQFRAGQYIDILLKDGKRRSFSMANAPHADEFIELHIRAVPGGTFSQHVMHEMKERAILRFEGPLGSFCLNEDSDKPIIFMAGGTGFAPIKAIIEHALHAHIDRQMVLYWGARSLRDLYLPDLPAKWQREYSHLTFIPVLSDPLPEDHWQGRTGLVHQAILDDFSDMAGYEVYACGAPIMIEVGQRAFAARGLPPEAFFADSFTYAAAPAGV